MGQCLGDSEGEVMNVLLGGGGEVMNGLMGTDISRKRGSDKEVWWRRHQW